MNRMQPPALPLWMLEHLTPAERDEALAGDLLEGFRGGRSNGWFWRQALGAWLGAWGRYFARRRSVLLFALLWSGLAPAWTAVIDRVEQEARVIGLRFNAPVSTLPSLMIWLSLQLLFLWVGTVVYFAGFARNRRPGGGILRACGVAAGLFLPTYFVTVVLMNLFAWPGLEIDRSGMTPLGEIADVGKWAIAIRVPYLVTLLCAMWRAVPRLAAAPRQRAEFGNGATALPTVRQVARDVDPDTAWRFFAFVVVAGLLNALIAGFLLCRLPESHAPTVASLVMRAAIYVALGAAAGIMGAWVYWNNPASPFRQDPPLAPHEHGPVRGDPAPLPFALFATVCAAGWLWVPAMVIFSEQVSGVTALVAAIGAFLLGAGLRSTTLMVFERAEPRMPAEAKPELFAESLYEVPGEAHGYFIALCLYAGGWALTGRSNMTAAALLAGAAFLFAWIRAGARTQGLKPKPRVAACGTTEVVPCYRAEESQSDCAEWFEVRREYRRAAVRLAWVVIAAVLVTMWSLMDGVAHRNHMLAMQAALAAKDEGKDANAHKGTARGMGGYESVILWPYPEKKQIVAPVPLQDGLLTPGTTRPVVVRFDGPYWYVQPPDERPGPEAHQAVGTPLKVGIESNNALPLIVKAHQNLRAMVRLTRCREIDVEIENRDERPGSYTMELQLTSTNLGHETRFSLGEQTVDSLPPIAGGMEGHSAALETLRFAVPAHATMRAFNGVTVVLTPDARHSKVGPRIAIQQFSFLPR